LLALLNLDLLGQVFDKLERRVSILIQENGLQVNEFGFVEHDPDLLNFHLALSSLKQKCEMTRDPRRRFIPLSAR
jgi:hypothetical protein